METSSSRPVWILAPSKMGKMTLGPDLRILAMAVALQARGREVILGLAECHRDLPPGIRFLPTEEAVDLIQPGDPLVIQPGIRLRSLWKLLRRRIPFHVDFFNVISAESLDHFQRYYSPAKAKSLSRRMCFREAILAQYAQKIYVSNSAQTSFLSGLIAPFSASRASDLPMRAIEVPMGIIDSPMPTDVPFPYPIELQGRPIFLWGGGIWSWMDPRPLLEAFKILYLKNNNAVLFFIAGKNHSENPDENYAMNAAKKYASEIGVAGYNVFFNKNQATPADLPKYLSHCFAGILFNSPSLESHQSWRTRLLDLLWAGKPALVAGKDPLSERMKATGAAISTGESPTEIALAVESMLSDDLSNMKIAASKMGQNMTWPKVLSPFIHSILDETNFSQSGVKFPALTFLKYWTI